MYNESGFFKAYDTMAWDFFFQMLQVLHFPPIFIAWIRECVCSSKFSVNMNGELTGFFGSSRGLRQGDPLSSYLFVLVMEAFSRLLNNRVEEAQQFVYHWRCSKTKMTHLTFADDLMIFCGNSVNNAKVIRSALSDFSGWSGLCPKPQKSYLYIAGSDSVYSVAI